MTNFKQELAMIDFAFKNGFKKVDRFTQKDGSVAYTGAWGTFVVEEGSDIVIDVIIKTLDERYPVIETKEVEIIETKEVEKIEVSELKDLTEKESEVLTAIIENSYEYGLGMEVSAISDSITIKGKVLSGVIGSLFKKGYLEEYLEGRGVGYDNFFNLTEHWFDKLVK